MAVKLSDIVLEPVRNDKNEIETQVLFVFNVNNKIYTAKNITIIDKDKNLHKGFTYGLNSVYFNYYNKLTENFIKLNKVKEKSAIEITLKKETHKIDYKNMLPTTHKYKYTINNPFTSINETKPIEKIEEDIEKYKNKLDEVKEIENRNFPQELKSFLERDLNKILEKKEFLEKLGGFLYAKTKSYDNYEISDFLTLNKAELLEEQTINILHRQLAKRFLKDEFNIEVNTPTITELEKITEDFVNKLEINEEDEFYQAVKKYVKAILNEDGIKYEDIKKIDNYFDNILFFKDKNKKYSLINVNLPQILFGNIAFLKIDRIEDLIDVKIDKNYILFKKVNNEELKELLKLKDKGKVDRTINILINKKTNEKFVTNLGEDIFISENIDIDKFIKKASAVTNNITYKEILTTRLEQTIEDLDEVNENKDFVKRKLLDIFYEHSPLRNLGLKDKKIPDISQMKGENLSIDDIIKNPYLADLYRHTNLFSVINLVLKRNKLTYPQNTSVVLDFDNMDFELPDTIEINKENLGMRKFKYLPIIKMSNDESKERFKKLLINEFKNFDDEEKLEEIIKKTHLVSIGINKELNVNNFTISTKPEILLHDDSGKIISSLNLDIFQYLDFVENQIVKLKDLVKTPSFQEDSQYKIITSISKMLKSYYQDFFGKDLQKAINYAKKFLVRAGGTIEIRELNDELRKDFINLELLIAQKLTHFNVIQKHLDEVKEILKSIKISPLEKQKLTSYFEDITNLYFKQDEINSLLIDIQYKNPEIKEQLKEAIEKIIKAIIDIKTLTKKETESFIYIYKILFNLSDIAQADTMEEKKKHLESARNGFDIWATNAVGLSQEQYQDAINATIISLKNKKTRSLNFFHDMGTGKTRLALFMAILKSALNPNEKIAFAVQNKNASDIYEQLRDMLPSLTIFVNKNFKNKNFVNNVEIPFSIIGEVAPNFTTATKAKIFKTSSFKSKQDIIDEYFSSIQEIKELIENKSLLELKNLALANQNILNIEQTIKEAYKKTIADELAKFDTPFKKDDFKNIYKLTYQNYLALAMYFELLNKSDNIDISKREYINKVVTKEIETIFSNYIEYLKHQKNKNISILPNNIISNMPYEKEIVIKEKNVQTASKVEEIKIKKNEYIENGNFHYFSYIYKNLSPQTNDKIWILTNSVSEHIQEAVNYISMIEKGEEFENSLKELENIEAVDTDMPFVKINGGISQQKAINIEEIKKIYNSNKEMLEKINIKNYDDFIYKINRFNEAYIYYTLINKEKDSYTKLSTISTNPTLKISSAEIEVSIDFNTQHEMPILLNPSQGIVESVEKAKYLKKEIKENNVVDVKKTAFLKNITLKIKTGVIKYDLKYDTPLNIKQKINLNAPFIFLADKKKNITYIIDEAHKKVLNREKIKKALQDNKNAFIIQLTGTPTKGNAGSLALTSNPLGSEEEIAVLKNNLSLIGGISKINSLLFQFLYCLEDKNDRKKAVNLLHKIALDANKSTLSDLIEKFKTDKFIENISMILYAKARKGALNKKEARLYTFLFNMEEMADLISETYEIEDKIKLPSKIFESLKTSDLLDTSLENIFLKKKKFLESLSGISNPRIVNILPDLENIYSIKTQKGRVYNLIDIDKISEGIYVSNKSLSDLEEMQYPKIKHIVKLAKEQEYINYINYLAEIMDFISLKISKTDEEEFKEINKYTTTKIEFEEYQKGITPDTASGNDTIGKLFKEYFFLGKKDENYLKREKTIKWIYEVLNYYLNNLATHPFEIGKHMPINSQTLEKLIKLHNKYEITFDFNYANIYLKNRNAQDSFVLLPKEIVIELNKFYPSIFKEEATTSFNFLNPQTNEIIDDLYNESVDILKENILEKNKNTIFYTNRTKSLLFKSLEALEKIYKNKKDEKPLYILINLPQVQELKKIFDKIDYQKLKEKGIKVILTDTSKIYYDYNYGIPRNENTIIFSNYKALAEGFRFPTMKEIIFSGKPSDVPTILQASARCFFPKKVFKTDIRLTTPMLYTNVSFKTNRESLTNITYQKSIAKTINEFNNNNSIDIEDTMKIFSKSYFKIEEVEKKAPQDEQKRIKSLAESIITSLRFIGSEVGGVKKAPKPVNIIKESFEKKEEVSKKIKLKK